MIQIIEKKVTELQPYKNNPRKNTAAVEVVANSIREFGFKIPIVIDTQGVIVCGHTRLKAAKRLGIKTVPCVVADDLTPEQVKAFRIADNTSNEIAEWNFELLASELKDIEDIDMTDFGLELDENKELTVFDSNGGELTATEYVSALNKGEQPTFKQKTEEVLINNMQNTGIKIFPGVGDYDIPALEVVKDFEQCQWICFDQFFNQEVKENRGAYGVHFFIHDYKFECVWSKIDRYIDDLLQHPYVVVPDFSMYSDFPQAVRIFNYYRNMWIGRYIQEKARETGAQCRVIPNIIYDKDNSDFVYAGIPKNGIVAVSSKGAFANENGEDIMRDCYMNMYNRLHPSLTLWFGMEMQGLPGNISNQSQFTDKYQRLKKLRKEKQNGK